ncbi:ROK family protein [Tianweitania sediminis]|uniref:ROK family protein n=2 Tax=Tianweitania sediminis TaxID=1502156 RepID=A0A8J7RGS2_9HYPH|nr:ROK family transcriptional regulator [Tianweitania sediminis]MBP0438146.1 ROK family protein [Tianweitania sediminis]
MLIRQDDLRLRNRHLVLSAVRVGGATSRTALANRTRLSHSTISAISADLIGDGVLCESPDTMQGRRGRPQIALALQPQAALVVTALLSLNNLSVALVDYAGKVQAQRRCDLPTTSMARSDLLDLVTSEIAELISARPWPAAAVRRIAFAIQGVTDAEARSLLWSPITPHGDVPFADLLEARFGVQTTVENDCNMLVFALQQGDPALYRSNFVALLLSHGIGMGLMLRGEVFHGTRSSAGEFGHVTHQPGGARCRCGRNGCIEAYAGSYALWRRAKGLPPTEMPEKAVSDAQVEDLMVAARERDGPEREAFHEAGTAIGYGLGSLFALIDPAPVALVGIGATAFDLLEEPIREALARTLGGQRSEAFSFRVVERPNMALTLEGGALHALTTLDAEIAGVAASALPARSTAAAAILR